MKDKHIYITKFVFNILKIKVTLPISILFELIWILKIISSDNLLLTFRGPYFSRCQFLDFFSHRKWYTDLSMIH